MALLEQFIMIDHLLDIRKTESTVSINNFILFIIQWLFFYWKMWNGVLKIDHYMLQSKQTLLA